MNETKTKMGRPPKAANEKRSERVMAMVRPSTKDAITRARGDQPESEFVAQILERAMRRREAQA